MSVQDTLKERGNVYGDFKSRAAIEYELKTLFKKHLSLGATPAVEIGLDAIAVKLSRILNGGHNHIDSWHDLGGYSLLVEQILTEELNND